MLLNSFNYLQKNRQQINRLVFQYFFSIFVIALLISGAFLLAQRQIEKQKSDTIFINLLNLQKFAAQKIYDEANELFLATKEKNLELKKHHLDELSNILKDFQKKQSVLHSKNIDTNTNLKHGEKIDILFSQTDLNYEPIIRYVGQITMFEPQDISKESLTQKDIDNLKKNVAGFHMFTDQIINQYDLESQAGLNDLKQYRIYFLLLAILVLATESFLIFLPIVDKIKVIFFDLSVAQKKLAEKGLILQKSNKKLNINQSLQRQIIELLRKNRNEIQQKTNEIIKLKDQFVFIAAHELRSPATAISWGIDLIEKHQQKERDIFLEKNQDIFKTIKDSSKNLMNLVDDLLDVARIESKTFSVEVKNVDLLKLINETIEQNRLLAQKNNVEILTEFDSFKKLGTIQTDERRLKEIFLNLVSNAIKYNKTNGKIFIKAKKEGEKIKFSIKDTGIGLSEKEQKNVFQKFWRSNSVKSNIEGTGLGLFVVKQIIEILGGNIWFESKKEEGTEFYFIIPIKQQGDIL